MTGRRDESPFHAGEQALQARAGVRARMEEIGSHVIRSAMPLQHREFFALLPFIVVGAVDLRRQLQATLLAGPHAGFVQSPNPTHLAVGALPPPDDPLAAALQPGSAVGLLGIELPTRRRNRANGSVAARDEQGFLVHVTQSFGNCPKYIQQRRMVAAPRHAATALVRQADRLDDRAAALVQQADTFFIASHAPQGSDVSHRGGLPGFVQVSDGGRMLAWPDYVGNSFFNTLGNLAVNGEAALVFADFGSGDLLHVNGRAEILWDGPQLQATPGAQRLLRLQVQQVVHRPAVLPWRWRLVEMSPTLLPFGA
jgi:predicted pyridoxine 5'-phosphate oxidase superfamily flavin-nucleotide-binding protein